MARFQQEKILYTREWNQEVDTFFIRKFEEQAVSGRVQSELDNMHAFRFAMEEVNRRMNKQYTFEKCLEQFRKLRRCFKVFSDILKHRGVCYDEETNSIFYDTEAWEEINKMDPLVVAYGTKGDPELAALRKIFHGDDDSVGFFDLQDITHLSSNLDGLSDPLKYKYPRYGFDDHLSNSFWSHVALPSSQGDYNTSTSVPAENTPLPGNDGAETTPDQTTANEIDTQSGT